MRRRQKVANRMNARANISERLQRTLDGFAENTFGRLKTGVMSQVLREVGLSGEVSRADSAPDVLAFQVQRVTGNGPGGMGERWLVEFVVTRRVQGPKWGIEGGSFRHV